MNLQIITQGRQSIKTLVAGFFILVFVGSIAQAEWEFDFSKRTKEIRKQEYDMPNDAQKKQSVFDYVFTSSEPIQEIVVLNTGKGFVPATLRVRKGMRYKVHVVNVNEDAKNVSFVMDSFSEHHATYYGKIKTFHINPKKEGVYSFQCPETSAQGRLVVHEAQSSVRMRTPAAEQ